MDPITNRLRLDRILSSAMAYPFNYGYIQKTLADDGDALDALVLIPNALLPGTNISCRVVGALVMKDEKGLDEKLLTVPADIVDKSYNTFQDINDINDAILDKIKHFFESYKQLDRGKWSEVEKFINKTEAYKLIRKYQNKFNENL